MQLNRKPRWQFMAKWQKTVVMKRKEKPNWEDCKWFETNYPEYPQRETAFCRTICWDHQGTEGLSRNSLGLQPAIPSPQKRNRRTKSREPNRAQEVLTKPLMEPRTRTLWNFWFSARRRREKARRVKRFMSRVFWSVLFNRRLVRVGAEARSLAWSVPEAVHGGQVFVCFKFWSHLSSD